jgi:septal ring factor EnvC (AmiA/AmiB activator)
MVGMFSFSEAVFKKILVVLIGVALGVQLLSGVCWPETKRGRKGSVSFNRKASVRSGAESRNDGGDLSEAAKAARASKEEKEKEARVIRNQIRKKQGEVREYTRKEAEVMSNLNDIDQRLNSANQKVGDLKKKIVLLEADMKTNYNELQNAKAHIGKNQAAVARRLAALYKLNRIGQINVMASSDSVYDMLKRKTSMEFILKSDENLLGNYRHNLQRLTELQGQLAEKRKENQSLALEFKTQIRLISKNRSERTSLLQDIREKKNLGYAALQSLKEASESLNNTIRELEKSIREMPVGERMASGGFPSRKGRLLMPVKGRVVRYFGKSTDNELQVATFNMGIQIRADRGEPIQAVAGGKVIFADWLKGYGNMIIVDHGDNYYSLYGNAEEMFKARGDSVEDGEVIATVGEAASLNGPGLHFEIRHRGEPINPISWFRRGGG